MLKLNMSAWISNKICVLLSLIIYLCFHFNSQVIWKLSPASHFHKSANNVLDLVSRSHAVLHILLRSPSKTQQLFLSLHTENRQRIHKKQQCLRSDYIINEFVIYSTGKKKNQPPGVQQWRLTRIFTKRNEQPNDRLGDPVAHMKNENLKVSLVSKRQNKYSETSLQKMIIEVGTQQQFKRNLLCAFICFLSSTVLVHANDHENTDRSCSWNTSSVLPLFILWLCDITSHHRVTHVHVSCL